MHIGNKIRSIIDVNEVNVTEFAKKINKSREYVYTILKKENIDTGLLQEIAKALSVPVVCFFDEDTLGRDGTVSDPDGEIKNGSPDIASERLDESIIYKMYKEKDAELIAMSEEVGRLKSENKNLKERIENLENQITLNKLSHGSQAVEYAKNVDVLGKEKVIP